MKLWAAVAIGLLLGGCSGAGAGEGGGGGRPEAGAASPYADAAVPPFTGGGGFDAFPLFAACDPASASSCPSGWTCYGEHTAPAWDLYDGGDVYGHCTIVGDCYGGAGATCSYLDGTCACPSLADGTPGWCHLDEDAGTHEWGDADPRSRLACIPIPR